MDVAALLDANLIYTIGHSNHPIERFIELLQSFGIEVLVDVRSHPYSRYATHFNADDLKASVLAAGIKYLFLGRELGGRPDGTEYYDAEGYVLYWRVAEAPFFLDGIARLEAGSRKYRVAIMCSEENPAGCHRHLLVGRVLGERGVDVRHIRGDGRLQTTNELVEGIQDKPQDIVTQLSFLGEVEETPPEVKEWKSIVSVLRRNQPRSSSDS